MCGSLYVHSLLTKKNQSYFVKYKYMSWIVKYIIAVGFKPCITYTCNCLQIQIYFFFSRTRREGNTALRSTQMTGHLMCSPRSQRLIWTTGSKCWTRSSTRQRPPPMSPWRRAEVPCEILNICWFCGYIFYPWTNIPIN